MSNKPHFEEPSLPCEESARLMSEADVKHWWKNFSKYPARGMISLEIKKLIKEQQHTLETVEPENLKKVQGIIQGLRMVHGLIQKEN